MILRNFSVFIHIGGYTFVFVKRKKTIQGETLYAYIVLQVQGF